MATLFDELVARSRLSKGVAPFTLSRLLLLAWVFDREAMTPDDLARALPDLEEGLAEYLSVDDLTRAMEDIRALVGSGLGAGTQ